jgi:uncharacterized membrane protein
MLEPTPERTPEQIAHDLVKGALERKRKETSFWGRLRRHFFAGLLILTPVILTLWIVGWLVNLIDGKTRRFIKELGLKFDFTILGRHFEDVIPMGFGLLVLFIVTCFIGMIASNFVGRRVLQTVDSLMHRVPGVNWIYKATQQVSHAFLNRNKDVFQEVVFVEYPRKGLISIGFVTNRRVPGVEVVGGEPLLSVFLPTTPNPTSGYLLLVPRSQCIPCPMNVEDSMKMVISGGVVIPESLVEEMTPIPITDESSTENT